ADDVPVVVRDLAERHGLTYRSRFTATVPAAQMQAGLARARARGDARRSALLEGRQSDYGLAVLTRGPLTGAVDHGLPDDRRERRVAQQVTTSVGGRSVTVL